VDRRALLSTLLVVATAHSADRPNCDPSLGLVDGACLERSIRELENDPCQRGGALDFGECARRAHEKADVELNRVYRELMSILPDAPGPNVLTKAKLRDDQRKWIRWKESYCDAYGEKTGGVQMWKSAYTVSCWARATEDQTRKLKALLKKARRSESGVR
jgi:uncharacterized protein YecT (DUF1311 family)